MFWPIRAHLMHSPLWRPPHGCIMAKLTPENLEKISRCVGEFPTLAGFSTNLFSRVSFKLYLLLINLNDIYTRKPFTVRAFASWAKHSVWARLIYIPYKWVSNYKLDMNNICREFNKCNSHPKKTTVMIMNVLLEFGVKKTKQKNLLVCMETVQEQKPAAKETHLNRKCCTYIYKKVTFYGEQHG